MKLETLTREQVQQVREWRNNEPQFLRTPHLITEQMQDEFYNNVINNRNSKHRYFAITEGYTVDLGEADDDGNVGCFGKDYVFTRFLGMGGLTNIEWENGTTEISLIINPECRGKGYGIGAVELLRHEGIHKMRLNGLYGEVYNCGNRSFWEKVVKQHSGYKTDLVKRKYWNGEMFGSMWFSI